VIIRAQAALRRAAGPARDCWSKLRARLDDRPLPACWVCRTWLRFALQDLTTAAFADGKFFNARETGGAEDGASVCPVQIGKR